jgi:hypothetical protein
MAPSSRDESLYGMEKNGAKNTKKKKKKQKKNF